MAGRCAGRSRRHSPVGFDRFGGSSVPWPRRSSPRGQAEQLLDHERPAREFAQTRATGASRVDRSSRRSSELRDGHGGRDPNGWLFGVRPVLKFDQMSSDVGSVCRGAAFGARAPVDDLRFVDLVAVRVVRRQARGSPTAQSTSVVRRRTCGRSRGGGCRRPAGRTTRVNQPAGSRRMMPLARSTHTQRVVDRLPRDRPELGPHLGGDSIRGAVRKPRDDSKHGQSLNRDPQAAFAEPLLWIEHKNRIDPK